MDPGFEVATSLQQFLFWQCCDGWYHKDAGHTYALLFTFHLFAKYGPEDNYVRFTEVEEGHSHTGWRFM